jgi:hypothetical protein
MSAGYSWQRRRSFLMVLMVEHDAGNAMTVSASDILFAITKQFKILFASL